MRGVTISIYMRFCVGVRRGVDFAPSRGREGVFSVKFPEVTISMWCACFALGFRALGRLGTRLRLFVADVDARYGGSCVPLYPSDVASPRPDLGGSS